MLMNIEAKDSNGVDLVLGDTVEVYDWCRGKQKLLFTGKVEWDDEDMQLTIQPEDGFFDIDNNDLWNKAKKVRING